MPRRSGPTDGTATIPAQPALHRRRASRRRQPPGVRQPGRCGFPSCASGRLRRLTGFGDTSSAPEREHADHRGHARQDLQRGFFSPASTAMASLFSAGATGHVAKSVNEHGRFDARLKSSVTLPSAAGAPIESDLAPGYVVTPLVASVNSTCREPSGRPKATNCPAAPDNSKSMTPRAVWWCSRPSTTAPVVTVFGCSNGVKVPWTRHCAPGA